MKRLCVSGVHWPTTSLSYCITNHVITCDQNHTKVIILTTTIMQTNSPARLPQSSVFEPAFHSILDSFILYSDTSLLTRLIVSDYSVWLVSTPLISQHSSNISIWSKSIVASVLQHVPLNTTNRFGACSAEFKINSLLLPFLSSPLTASQILWNQPSVSEKAYWRIIELGKEEVSRGWR